MSNGNVLQILNNVKNINILSGNNYIVTSDIIADYFEANKDLIRYFIKSNKQELDLLGLRVIKGQELKEFKLSTGFNLVSSKNNYSALTIFPLKIMLKFSILLAGSDIAKLVREELIKQNPKLYEELSNGHRLKFKKFEQKYWDYLSFSFGDEYIQKQVSCGSYLIDFVLYENIAIEIDENGHSSYSGEKEMIREEYIRSNGYKLVRFNPHRQKPYELIDMILKSK